MAQRQRILRPAKTAMSSMEIILGEPSRLERLAVDIHDHYVSACANDPDRVQKAMIVCSNRKIAYDLLQKFKEHYPEWFEKKKVPDGSSASEEELRELKPMPFIAMVASVAGNDASDMYKSISAALRTANGPRNWTLRSSRISPISALPSSLICGSQALTCLL